MARRQWEGLSGWPAELRLKLPVLVILRDFARGLKEGDSPGAKLLWNFIARDLDTRNLGFAGPFVLRALERGEALVFFDGLDEVPPESRPLVLKSLEGFAQTYGDCRLLVTCRVVAYHPAKWHLAERFPSFTLAPFSEEKIGRFIEAWYGEIGQRRKDTRERVRQLAAKLREAVGRPDLRRLAPNPLLLTVMALIHTHDKELPDHRALLYERCVDILLWRWESLKEDGGGEPELQKRLREAECYRNELLDKLRMLAFDAHARGGAEEGQAAGIPEPNLLQALAMLHPKESWDWAKQVVDLMRQRSGLLIEREPGIFAFPHRTFQEYLAGVHLALGDNAVSRAADLAVQGDYWREVILLAVGYQVRCTPRPDYDLPLYLFDELCPEAAAVSDPAWRLSRLAGEILLEMGVGRAEKQKRGQERVARARSRLTALVEQCRLGPFERAAAGEVLGSLGDPRFDPDRYYLPCLYRGEVEPMFGFVEIPAGPFWMGSEPGDPEASDDEYGNPNPLEIPYAYWISRYPVTVSQFGEFVATGGYEDAAFWKGEAAWRWLKAEPRTGPAEWERQKLYPNRPVSYVTWYEATAYCAWLDARLREAGSIPEGCLLRLPSEAEWEKAARWRPGEASSSLRYPWGNEDWTPARANIDDGGIGHPTPVGMYPEGTTASGLHDLAGNVWEWTRTGMGTYPYDPQRNGPEEGTRVVRGGSWDYDSCRARCAYRYWYNPDLNWGNGGFRVVLSLANSGF